MEGKTKFSYMGYQEMIADMTTALKGAEEVMVDLELPQQAERARDAADKLKSHVFSVGIMGEFKRGKSTVINALLGEEIAPADVKPASATLNRINRISEYVTKLTDESAAISEKVEQAVVEYPCEFCKNNVEIIDTPGLNDDDRMEAVSEAVIPKLDAVVFVVSASAPFGKSEAEFFRGKLMTSEVSRLIVIVNRIDDIYRESDRPRIVETIRDRIVHEILERMASIHGEDSAIYKETRNKLADLTLYPMSAIQALVGRTDHQPELVEKSGILAFEQRLGRLLTQERGALEIIRAGNMITALLAEGEKALNLRINALEMSTEEFLKNQKEAEKKIEDLRKGKKEETERIHKKGIEIRDQMEDIVREKYDDLDRKVREFINNYPIHSGNLGPKGATEEFSRKISVDMEQEIKQALSDYAEQISVFLQSSIGDESIRVQNYMGSLSEKLSFLGSSFRNGDSAWKTGGSIAVDAASNVAGLFLSAFGSTAVGAGMFGLGGAIEGYRVAGFKGLATGLVGGGVTSLAVVSAMVALGAVPAMLPFAIITGACGHRKEDRQRTAGGTPFGELGAKAGADADRRAYKPDGGRVGGAYLRHRGYSEGHRRRNRQGG